MSRQQRITESVIGTGVFTLASGIFWDLGFKGVAFALGMISILGLATAIINYLSLEN